MNAIPLTDALNQLAAYIGVSADDMHQYASEDALGGYSPVKSLELWPVGSMFGVEGQTLYAITRALKPLNVINLGTYHGCSVAHIAAALKANGNPKARVYAVDMTIRDMPLIPDDLRPYIATVESEGVAYLGKKWPAKVSLVFEDMIHSEPEVKAVWEIARAKANLGAVVVSHDSAHHLVGRDVMNGIRGAGIEGGLNLMIEPSDCGLFLWKQTQDN